MNVRLGGMDVGSTTTRLVELEASLVHGVGGRWEVAESRLIASAVHLTPFMGENLDEAALCDLVPPAWSAEPTDGNSVLLTGLAAAAPNVVSSVLKIRERVGDDSVVVTAGDPGLEAWVAFQGTARAHSLANPGRWVVNLDIGGGTTNLAVGRAGEVERVGCVRVGARHVRVCPAGTVLGLSETGGRVLAYLGLSTERLSEADRETIARFWVDTLWDFVAGRCLALPELVELPVGELGGEPIVLLSGGVGELVAGADLAMEHFDDLGPRIARRLRASDVWNMRAPREVSLGSATVFGLALHATEHAGKSVFAPHLPLGDRPILARARADDPSAFAPVRRGGALQLVDCPTDAASVRALAGRLREVLGPEPVVVLVDADIGLILGSLATNWGASTFPLVVLDSLAPRPARCVRLRRDAAGSVQVRYFGFA